MDDSTFILGIIPTTLVIVAEILTPVSRDIIRSQVLDAANQITSDDEQAHNITDLVADTASGASKVTLLIPTWINATAGLVAALIDTVPSLYIAILALIWTSIWGLAGAKYFSVLVYHKTSRYIPLLRGKGIPYTGFLSAIIIIVNAVVIVLTLWMRFFPPSSPWFSSLNAPVHGPLDRVFINLHVTPDIGQSSIWYSGDIPVPQAESPSVCPRTPTKNGGRSR